MIVAVKKKIIVKKTLIIGVLTYNFLHITDGLLQPTYTLNANSTLILFYLGI